MSLPTNPAQKDADDAKRKSDKELRKERFSKSMAKYKAEGCSDEDAMSKALDDMDEDDAAPEDGVQKALDAISDILKGGANNQAIVSKDKMDEILKSMDGTAKGQLEVVQKEQFETRKTMREYVDVVKALTGAFATLGEELKKSLDTLGAQVAELKAAPAVDVSKGLKADEVPEHLSKPTAVTEPQATDGAVVPTAADAAATPKGPSVGDFISKANAFVEANPNSEHIKPLAHAVMDLCNPNSADMFKKHVDDFGKIIGL